MRIDVTVPATSANLGSAFDCAGLALGLYNKISIEEWDSIVVETADGAPLPSGEENLVVETVKNFYKTVGKTFRGLHMIQESNIPETRGLGSSSACIAAGLTGANKLLGSPVDKRKLADIGVAMEGHPDNVLPAFYGGFVAAALDGTKTSFVRADIGDKISFAVFVPPFEMKTSFARKILPQTVPLTDAVYNMSRAVLLTAAFLTGDFSNLKIAVQDRLHQQHRLPLISGADDIFRLADRLGAAATYLSGAGPTIISIVEKENTSFFEKAEANLVDIPYGYKLLRLEADNQGVRIDN